MEKLKTSEFQWHSDQADIPGMSAQEMKAFLDAPILLLIAKINEIIEKKPDPPLNINGEIHVDDLPIGLSYAVGDTELEFLTNVETGEEAKLPIASGACIVKTIQKLQTDAESLDAAAVYVLYGNKVETDDEGKETVVIMEQLAPSYDNQYCGVSYSIHKTVKGESNSAGGEIDTSNFVSKDNVVTEFDPEDPEINNYIPSVQALATLSATKMDKARADEKFAEMDNAIQTHDENIYIHGLLINELRKEKLDAVKGVSGTIGIADLRAINYAAEEVTLRYPINAETFEMGSIVLAPGSMILKMPFEVNGMECGYFYIFPSYKEGEDDLGANREILYERLIPTYDELYGGMIYSLQSVGGYTVGEGIGIENGIISLAIEKAEGGSY